MDQGVKTFAVFGNTYQAEKSANIADVLNGIIMAGGRVVIEEEFAHFVERVSDLSGIAYATSPSAEIEADMAVSIGGDGTFLKAVEQVGARMMPLIGINTGRLGFISDLQPRESASFMCAVMAGRYQIEERSLLELRTEGETLKGSPYALNEIAVMKHDMSSMISVTTLVNDSYLATYQADGLVISTPTGSTGYSLSVGGPIISPDSQSIVLSPIAAHSLSIRPFILNDDVRVRLEVESRSHNYMVAIDGRSESLLETTRLEVTRAPYSIKIVRPEGHSFFDTLRHKLLWGADRRYECSEGVFGGIDGEGAVPPSEPVSSLLSKP